jgi:hypothetical protein
LSGSSSTIAFILVIARTTQPSMAFAAPDRPLPAPRGTIGTPAAAQARTTACTCAASLGSTTATGRPWGASGIMSRW